MAKAIRDADGVFLCATLEAAMLNAAMYNYAESMPALWAASDDQCKPFYDARDGTGFTPLMFAAIFNSLEVGQMLACTCALSK